MILAIIQARMSSTRLPGKTLMMLHGKPVLQWVVEAAQNANLIDVTTVATSAMGSDLRITEYCNHNKINYATGPLHDVLSRFYQTALKYKPEHVVRLTADCPLLFPEIIDDTIDFHLKGAYDYTWNRDCYPSGFDVEVMTFETLSKANREAVTAHDREHVTTYIKTNDFKLGSYNDGGKLPGHWSIDTMADYENVSDAFILLKGWSRGA